MGLYYFEFVVAAILAVAADAVLVAKHLLKLIWLPHWPACMCKISREETTWRLGASGRKRAERSG
jgi:hypothetical protein